MLIFDCAESNTQKKIRKEAKAVKNKSLRTFWKINNPQEANAMLFLEVYNLCNWKASDI